ncbi:hypothetical protein EVAR_24056_1 [Eumeta japonica]|uniref:Uncharacterized protein n=1 Tax=Eumeta variegata TaxID=151549 RepID=A0A4C1VRE5_EUMVA|nr:hypothetical protein EVAR_24056_1 [Eumeta japonica]
MSPKTVERDRVPTSPARQSYKLSIPCWRNYITHTCTRVRTHTLGGKLSRMRRSPLRLNTCSGAGKLSRIVADETRNSRPVRWASEYCQVYAIVFHVRKPGGGVDWHPGRDDDGDNAYPGECRDYASLVLCDSKLAGVLPYLRFKDGSQTDLDPARVLHTEVNFDPFGG